MERKNFVSSSILRQSNCLSKFLVRIQYFTPSVYMHILNEANSCIIIGCTNHAKPGSSCEKKKTGYQTNTVLSVVTTWHHPVLLSDKEKLGPDCMIIHFP